MVYTSINNEKIKNIKKLQTKKHRNESKCFFIESEHLVQEAYQNGLLQTLIIEENTDFLLDVETIKVNKTVLNYLSELESPKQVMGICIKNKEKEIGKRVLALDNIQDPGNLGTIIRSAVAFHIDTILLGKDTVDVYNSKVVRSSQGMIFNIDIKEVELLETLQALKEKNYNLVGTRVDKGEDIRITPIEQPFVLIMGNEGNGIKQKILEQCNQYIYIKMNQDCESLNVAVATSILLYELDK